MQLFAIALAGEQRACMHTAAGWFLGRREARGDRFGKDNFGCIGLGVQPMLSSGGNAPRPRRFMRWSSPEAPILQFELLRCTLDAGRADFSRDRRMQSGFFRRISPSSRDCSFRRGRVLKKARSLARGSSQRLPSAGSQSLLSGAIIERASSHRPLGGTQASTEAAPRARHATVWPPRSPR